MIREKVLGRDHPDVARSLNKLADLYERQGRYADAEPPYQRAATIREAALAANHPDTTISLNNLASLYQTEGRTADALPIMQRMIAVGRAQLRVALPVLFAAQRHQLIASDTALDGALNVLQRGTQSHRCVRGQQACGPARRWQRPAGLTRSPRPGPCRRSRDAGQGDRRRRVQGTFEARPRRRAAQSHTAGGDFRRARQLSKDLRRRIPRLRGAVESFADDGEGDSGAVIKR
jgi:tetratricopeptide (TPR) repeat protein